MLEKRRSPASAPDRLHQGHGRDATPSSAEGPSSPVDCRACNGEGVEPPLGSEQAVVGPPRWDLNGVLPVLLLGVFSLAVVLAAVAYSRWGIQVWVCPFRAVTHRPCPGCYGIRSLAALLQGDVLTAFRLNPLAAVLALVGMPGGILALLVLPRQAWHKLLGSRLFLQVLLAVIAANWIYLLAVRH